ncbi:MAG: glycosyltransferase family 4 protein [Candidatus Aenigmarchaeota archaeon]|nr:glycosyltransferase family 4 protein [Candidatus Aenigmarchaeota archaeon]
MKFLIIGWGAGDSFSGGMDVHVLNVSKALAKKGHSVTLFATDGKPTETIKNLKIIPVNLAKKPNSIDDFISAVKEYNEKIKSSSKELDFDVIISHDWIGVAAAEKIKDTTGKLWLHTVHSLEHMRSLNDSKGDIEKFEKKGIVGADTVFTVSNFMKDAIHERYRRTTEVIYNGSSFGVNELVERNPYSTHTVLYVGRLTAQKGIEYLILAAKKILGVVPNARFIIVGTGELEESLKSFALALGFFDSFEFLGFISKKRLAELYSTASVFASPSIYEPFGITVLDAVLFSCPVVATKNTGANELFSCGITIVEPQDSVSLSDAVVRVLKNHDEFEALAKNAKVVVETKDFWAECGRIIEKTSVSKNAD